MPWPRLGAASLAVVLGALTTGAADAQSPRGGAVACGGLYTVERGDTLSEIARRAYEQADYLRIFEANRDILRTPTVIEIGDRLYIPCADGSGPRTRAEYIAAGSPTPVTAPASQTAALADEQPAAAAQSALPEDAFASLKVLETVSPFAGPRLPEGGMITELISRAMLRAPTPVGFDVNFDASGGEWRDELGGDSHALGFPAVRPDCTRRGGVSERLRERCVDYVYSAPLFEYQVSGYVVFGGPFATATDPSDFAEARICRPVGVLLGDLEEDGLTTPTGGLRSAADTVSCLRLLEAGEVDLVTTVRGEAELTIREMGISALVSEVPSMRRTVTVHAVGDRNDPQVAGYLELIDRGIAEMRRSGEWSDVVQNHLRDGRFSGS